jgi:hypothetical protein
MIVRDYCPEDKEALEDIHRTQGLDYKLSDLEAPLVIVKKVAVDEDGKIIGAIYGKLQLELALLLDQDLGPAGKMDVINALDGSVKDSAYEQGLDQQVAYLPPGIEEKFAKRLKLLGWQPMREGWKPWCFDLA